MVLETNPWVESLLDMTFDLMINFHRNLTRFSYNGMSILHLLCAIGQEDKVQRLLEETEMDCLVNYRSSRCFVYYQLITCGRQFRFSEAWLRPLWLGSTPLHFAIASGSVECVTHLLSHGADVNLPVRMDIDEKELFLPLSQACVKVKQQ